MITVQVARKFEIWTAPKCAGGTRSAVLTDVSAAVATVSLGGDGALRLAMPLTEPTAALAVAHSILRVDENDTPSYDEWRIDDTTRDAGAGLLNIVAVPLSTLLGRRALVDQLDGVGGRRYNFDIVGMTPSAIISAYVLPALTAVGITWVSSGTISNNVPIDVPVSWDSPWSLLKKIEAALALELQLRRVSTTSYTIDLLTAVGSSAPIADIRFAKNMLSSALRNSTDQQGTRIFPRGAEADGYHATMARAAWRVVSAGGGVVVLEDPAGADGPIQFDGQLAPYTALGGVAVGACYLMRVDGSLTAVSASSASAQSVTVASSAGITAGDLVQFRADAAGNDLTWLDSPTDAIRDGFVVGTLDQPDIPASNNVIPNAAERAWGGSLPDGWTAYGAPTITQETAAPLWQTAGKSIKVVAAAANLGVLSPSGKVRPSTARPFGSGYATVRVSSGQVRVELVVTTGSGTTILPATPAVATSTQRNQWETLGVSGEDLNALGALSVQVRVVSHGGAATFYVDGAQHTETASQEPFVEGSGGTKLWQFANERLRLFGAPAVEHRFTLIDLARIDPATWAGDCSIVFGGRVQVTDTRTVGGSGTYSTRIVTVERDYITPGNTAITLSTRPEDLQGFFARPSKAGRVPATATEIVGDGVGPSLEVVATPGPTSYSIAWSGTPPILLSIDGGAWTTPPASPITVTRPAAGQASTVYTFRGIINGQTVTDEVDVLSIDKDTVTPDLVVTPSAPTTTTQVFTISSTSPGGAPAATITVTLRGTTGSSANIGALADGTTYTIPSGDVVTVNRPAFNTTTQASISVAASISGGGAERIGRTILNQVKDNFGPSLVVTPTPGPSSYSLAYTYTGTILLSIDGGTYASPGASPITVTRTTSAQTYTFKCDRDSQTITHTELIPALVIAPPPATPSFTSVSNNTPNDSTDSFDISWVPADAPGGATYNVHVFEQTHATNASRGEWAAFIGVASAYTYTSVRPWDFDVGGGFTKTYKYYVEMISGATVVATSQTYTLVVDTTA